MRLVSLLPLLLPVLSLSQTSKLEKQVVGSWKYDIKTMKITLEPSAKAELVKAGASGQAQFEQAKKQLGELATRMTFTFKQDHHFSALFTTEEKPMTLSGKWSFSGRQIKVIMDKPDKSTTLPTMQLEPTGKTIMTSCTTAGFGSYTMRMVRRT